MALIDCVFTATVLIRLNTCWQICGMLHSDLRYMDDELRAKPTPEQNPLLSKKINLLYQLLTTQAAISQASTEPNVALNVKVDESSTPKATPPKPAPVPSEQSTGKKVDFENSAMRLSLPIPVTAEQRLLMITIGDDFTHFWFPSWRKFLSLKRIQNAFAVTKQLNKAIELSQNDNYPKVFVSHLHDNCIFIGPYDETGRQNFALFVKHENHMVLSEVYYKEPGNTYTKKTKGTQSLKN